MKQKIKQRYFSCKRRLADALQCKTEKLSVKGKKLLLGLFCLFFVSMSICAIVNAFTAKQKPLAVKESMPRITHEKEAPALPFISKKEFERIEKFKQQIYALPKPVLDSFMQARPKLMDSIAQIENIYQSQK
ncbi:MAG TPA: hypothetical protein VG738_19690 [Chitinophagaceae bacterium]|nr:hypothetical protein [Chitinophagaceae bacterium]